MLYFWILLITIVRCMVACQYCHQCCLSFLTPHGVPRGYIRNVAATNRACHSGDHECDYYPVILSFVAMTWQGGSDSWIGVSVMNWPGSRLSTKNVFSGMGVSIMKTSQPVRPSCLVHPDPRLGMRHLWWRHKGSVTSQLTDLIKWPTYI